MPTENRSSNTEMVSVPCEHELKIRQTPLADLLSGLKTGEVRDCSDREFAVGDTVLLREIDDSRDYTGTVLRRTITHVQKHYGLPDHLCVLSYGQPAPQTHPEPIAWMVGTAFWWTKEEAERDAAETGLPIVGLGPMTDTYAIDQLSQIIRGLNDERDEIGSEAARLRAQLAERDALLRESLCHAQRLEPMSVSCFNRIDAALSASAEPSAPTSQTINGHKLNCKALDDYKPGGCSCGRVEASAPAVQAVRAGMLGDGISTLVYHALLPNGCAACSHMLDVRDEGLAKDKPVEMRCKKKACRNLFEQADSASS
ncbi:DUF3850 domain-containing protein [Pseudomonas putida]|uniref:DUF3850 domain-containing protein n=1 Tax=Pseudomonas putida TaxID=303 RepID=UPI0018AA88A3|nr:DUF3850 domain-containing protein [Pseudomonas putida]MBF8669657.1 DUF3850 domain-containing protein [Pseudomonas putida]MBF8712763.1 DUF3850 domain-containing protein [Pseudomonas putida]